MSKPLEAHWGWESPTCQLRGHFLGHWLSAASTLAAATDDDELKGKAEKIITHLARCQKENGDEWVFSIPEKFLEWALQGKQVWAPHYTIHKTLMGLLDSYFYLQNQLALEILVKSARWFLRWTDKLSRKQMDDLLDYETGGMLEVWANLYAITHDPAHLTLLNRYDRPRLFERLLRGEDPLTNRHANTTIPEAHGAARAYEVTGEERWKNIVMAYWKCAVTDRGTFATGGQTSGEIWTPPFSFSARLSDKNQEHCVVYNMIRLADYLLRWTGDPVYADYVERNLYNGILAQQNPLNGMITYFLPLRPDSHKHWGTQTDDFWCCHGTLVQAHTLYHQLTYHKSSDGLTINQFIPSQLSFYWSEKDTNIKLHLDQDHKSSNSQAHLSDGSLHHPDTWSLIIKIQCSNPSEFTLQIRLPEWVVGEPKVSIDHVPHSIPHQEGRPSYISLHRIYLDNTIHLEMPIKLRSIPLPDQPETVAFLYGPVVLAGLCNEERRLFGDKGHPENILIPDGEREWSSWKLGFRTIGQDHGIRFIPLYEVIDEAYSVYFPVGQR